LLLDFSITVILILITGILLNAVNRLLSEQA